MQEGVKALVYYSLGMQNQNDDLTFSHQTL